jgi:hypothetical protein
LEQQNIELNIRLRELGATSNELAVCYFASYASMIVSLMYPEGGEEWVRPDLLCMALLLGETGAAKPGWWTDEFVGDRLKKEKHSCGESGQTSAARFLGLEGFPCDFENWTFASNVARQDHEKHT